MLQILPHLSFFIRKKEALHKWYNMDWFSGLMVAGWWWWLDGGWWFVYYSI